MPNAATDETTAIGLSSNASFLDPSAIVASDSVNSGELCMASDSPNGHYSVLSDSKILARYVANI